MPLPDLAKSSEVEVRFAAEAAAVTCVDLEHRYLGRHGPAGAAMRAAVDSANGWSGTLRLFAAKAERPKEHRR